MISIFLLELNQYDKAWEYITRVCRHRIFDIWQSYWPIYNILINTKKYDDALSISEWMNQLCISVAGVKSSYYHRAVAAVVYLFILNWKLAMIILAAIPLIGLITGIFTPMHEKYSRIDKENED